MFGEIVFFKEFTSFASKLCKLLSNLVVLNDAQRLGLAAALAFNELFARTSAQ
jgi:hypothetical protein